MMVQVYFLKKVWLKFYKTIGLQHTIPLLRPQAPVDSVSTFWTTGAWTNYKWKNYAIGF